MDVHHDHGAGHHGANGHRQSPASGATAVPIGTDVTATFSAAVQPSTISFVLKRGSTTITSKVSYDPATDRVELVPSSSLAYSTSYTATLSGAKDLYGNTMTSTSWSFTTGASPGTSPPAVTAETPAPNAILVATSSTVTATFNEAVTASSVNTTNFVLKTSGGSTVAATVSYNTTTHVATLTPSSALVASSTYTATISGVTDSGGHKMASAFTWSFTTAGAAVTTAPTVTAEPGIGRDWRGHRQPREGDVQCRSPTQHDHLHAQERVDYRRGNGDL